MSAARQAAHKSHQAIAKRDGDFLRRLLLYLVILIPPFVLVPTARDAFRLPKLMVSEWLGLLSLVPLAWSWGRRAELPRRWPVALLALLPLLVLALLSLATTTHPEAARRALPSLFIGAACLVGWSAGTTRATLERGLRGLLVPGAVLALLGVLQFHGVYRPFAFGSMVTERLAVTSLAGNAGDLAAYLVLPCLLGQWFAFRGNGRDRWLSAAATLLCAYGLVVTQTLTALVALVAATALLWAFLLPRRRAVLGAAAVAALAVIVLVALPPLRTRVTGKVAQIRAGDWNSVLTYRLDGWAAARWMLDRHPLTGVGFGGFRAEYTPAKEALLDQGHVFSSWSAIQTTFGNAHNDLLEVAAELGWPGVAAVVWAVVLLWRAARRSAAGRRPLLAAGTLAMAIVALLNFPFETALVAYSWLVFLAWAAAPDGTEPAPA